MELFRDLIPLLTVIVTALAGWLAGAGSWNRLERALALYEKMPESVRPDFELIVQRRARRIRNADAIPRWPLFLFVLAFTFYFTTERLDVSISNLKAKGNPETIGDEKYQVNQDQIEVLQVIANALTLLTWASVLLGLAGLLLMVPIIRTEVDKFLGGQKSSRQRRSSASPSPKQNESVGDPG